MRIEIDDLVEVGIGTIFVLIAASILIQIYIPKYEEIVQSLLKGAIELIIPALIGAVLGLLAWEIIKEIE